MATHVVIIIDDSSDFEYTPELCPRIELFKKHGLEFKNFYTHAVCTLSRAAFMYSSYGKQLGTINEYPLFNDKPVNGYPSIASVLSANGYATALIGKWHGGIDPAYPATHTDPFAQAPITRGYQEWRAGSAGNLGDSGGDYFNWTRFDSTASGFTKTVITDTTHADPTKYAPILQVQDVVAWLSATSGNPNRFLHLAFNLPHAPFHVPPSSLLGGYTGETTTNRGKYLAMLRAVDTAVGSVLDALGSVPNVWIWSDNGTPDSVPPDGINADRLKRSSYQEGTHVLGVYRQNGMPVGTSNRMIHSIDIGASVLNAAGIAIPTQWDGLPFGHTHVLMEIEKDDGSKDRACRTGCYLLRELTSVSAVVTEELYYLPEDPDEVANVIQRPKHGAALSWLRARLAAAVV